MGKPELPDPSNRGLVVGSKPWVDARLAQLPGYPSTTDLLEAFGDKARLLDAYSQGWLTKEAEEALEATPQRLSCWLQARTLRVLLRGQL